jgi:hypothetical protein
MHNIPDECGKLVKGSHGHVKRNTSLSTLIPQKKILKTCKPGKIFPNAIRNLEELHADGMVSLVQKVLEEKIVALLEEGL